MALRGSLGDRQGARDDIAEDGRQPTAHSRRLQETGPSCLIPEMGFGFWLKVAAIAVAIAIVSVIVLLLVSSAFVAWGIFGGFLALAIVLMLIGWITDRRRARAEMS
jgi:uncharacterized membrane protein